jgi:hypothetical protein
MFKHHLRTEIIIEATPETVWKTLTDFKSYPKWNPFIKNIEGNLVKGERLTVQFENGTFKPTVMSLKKGEELEWLGKLGWGGLFDGRHRFELQEEGNGTTRLIHEEYFNGLLIPLMRRKLDGEIREGFEGMNEALKRKVEQE